MNERSLRVLEWQKIVAQVSEFTSFSLGRDLILALLPLTQMERIRAQLAQTTEALSYLWQFSDPPFGGATDIQEIIKHAKVSGILDGSQLLQVGGVLYCAGQMRHYLTKLDSELAGFSASLAHLPQLVSAINRCLDDDGSVKDQASPELASIRQRMRTLANRVRDKLDGIVHSSTAQKVLQEPIVTLRNGRYVVPVKAECKSQFAGIVHDQSASGATFFMEPMVVVELNNQLRIAEQDEEKEVMRILRQLSSLVAQEAEALRSTVLTLADLDAIFAKGKYSRWIQGTEPQVNDLGRINIRQGRHPLLTGDVVPIDLWLGDKFHMLVVTGPNTGGKTVTLKTVGLFCLMAQAGLHIPARDGSEIAVFEGIYADIGDEQSIEQSLSTFSSHMSNIVNILSHADDRSLVLLDELGAGTDPTEGAALATALLDNLRRRGITTIATTHYSELKNFAYAHDDVENASVEFDVQTLRPTYHLSIGIPGKSNAFAIALRLGLDQQVVGAARALLSEEQVQVEDIIGEIERNRLTAREQRAVAERLRQEVEASKAQYEQLKHELATKRNEMIEDARQEAEDLVTQTRHELDLLVGELRRQQNVDLERMVVEQRQKLVEKQKSLQKVRAVRQDNVVPQDLKPGEQVRIRSLNQVGHVVETSSTHVQVQAGIMKVNVKSDDVERVEQRQTYVVPQRAGKSVQSSKLKSATIKPELDLRGLTVEEALLAVDKYLDDAFLSSLGAVRIIHGKGTGALREAIREQLNGHAQVKSFRLGESSEGGSGVTVVELNNM